MDTHLHLIYPEKFSYPWLSGKPIDRRWPAEDYWAEARPLGIEAALHMEVDVAEKDMLDETDFVLALPGIIGAIAACRPEHPNFPDKIEQISARQHVKGVRRILHEAPDDLSQSNLFVENIRRLADYNLSFDLVVRSDQLAIGQALVERAPEVTFILDHCGNPDIAGEGLDPWRSRIRDIARAPNLHAKVSGIVNHCDHGWTADTLRLYVEHLIDCFGWDRVVWGSDHPVVTTRGTLTSWVQATQDIVATCSKEEQQKLFHHNAERIYKL